MADSGPAPSPVNPPNPASPPAGGGDAAALAVLVGFARELRRRGLPVGGGRVLAFAQAAAALAPLDAERLRLAARATLASSRAHLDILDEAFTQYFSASGLGADLHRAAAALGGDNGEAPSKDLPLLVDPGARADGEAGRELETLKIGLVASNAEALHARAFEELDESERAAALALVRRLRVQLPERRVRRLRPARGGRRLDVRRTLRRSLRTQGEPLDRAWRTRQSRQRPLVLLLDVSGSMSSYSRALLQFGFAALAAGTRVEVLCFGTRLTRVTRALRSRNPDAALTAVAAQVVDWDGGTRIGGCIKELLDRFGQHAWLRGSVLVLCSDGLDRGDPEQLAEAMARLHRLVHRVVWVNPLKGSPRYEPLARGMAAALPHVDEFLPGHNVSSLHTLSEVLGRLARR